MVAKRWIIGIMVLGLVVSTLHIFSSEAAEKKRSPMALTFYGDPLGSDGHSFSYATGDIIKKNHPWLTCSVVETMGNVDNIKRLNDLPLDKQKRSLSLAIDVLLNLAKYGKGPFGKTGPITDWRVLFTVYTPATHFQTIDPKIKTPKDLIGKRIGMPPRAHGLSKVASWILGPCWEVKDQVKLIHMPMGMLKDALIDGTIDAVAAGGMYFSPEEGIKVSPFNEVIMAARKDVCAIGLSKEAFENGKKNAPKDPFTWGPVKANSLRQGYPKNNTGILRVALTVFTSKNMDEEVAYEIVKTAGENTHKYKEYFDKGKAARLETFIANAWSEKQYHPGALRYYKEKGLTIKGTL